MRRLFLALMVVVVGWSSASAQTVLFDSNGFETAAGYSTSSLLNQNGWTGTFGSNTFTVQNTLSATGSQAVQVSGGNGDGYIWPTIGYTPAPGEIVRIQTDIARSTPSAIPSNTVGVDVYNVAGTIETTRFGLIAVSGAINVFVTAPFNTTTMQFDPNSTQIFNVFFGAAIPANTFVNFNARLDYAAKNYRLLINGQDIGETIPFIDNTAANSGIGDADLYVETQAGATDFGFFDNYRVTVIPVPEPASVGLIAGVVGIVAVRLRRRR